MAITPPPVRMGPNKGKPIRSRLLLMGHPESGKTHMFFTIAKWFQDLGSDAMFYGVNSDDTWDVLASNPEFCDLTNVDWINVKTLQQFIDGVTYFNSKGKEGDFLAVDRVDTAWEAAQTEYIKMAAKSIKEKHKNNKAMTLGEAWLASGERPNDQMDWPFINSRYDELMTTAFDFPGHVYAMCGVTKLGKEGEKEDAITRQNRDLFDGIGFKNSSQKRDPTRFHQILYVEGQAGRKRGQRLATVKDKHPGAVMLGKSMSNGKNVVAEKIDDFVMDYLVKGAGWTM